MADLPKGLSGQNVRRALERAGFVFTRQRGSHMLLYRSEPKARVVVPNHRSMKLGTLKQIIADSGLSVDEFVSLL